MSELSKNSQSAIIGDLLETSLPVFERVVTVLRAASTVEAAAKEEIAAGLNRAHDRIEKQIGLNLAELDEVSRPLLDAAEKIARRAGGGSRNRRAHATDGPGLKVSKSGGSGLTTPVPVTRGSGIKPIKSKRSKAGG
ncbi:MAG: hypothetical protein EOP83_24830 [Verrucomicrobiaceae bacterium]|nr:MAG: hypothetical protein EOP83_24830 [Verrucomicrobiaceae bacterium]